jgi:hypothetical protein
MAVKTFTTGEVLTASDTNTYLANAGLVYVTSTTVGSAVSSVTISNCFSATYDDYLVLYHGGTSTTKNDLGIRMGSTTANYYYASVYKDYGAGAINYVTVNNGANWTYAGCQDNPNALDVRIYSPYKSEKTMINALYVGPAADRVVASAGGFLDNTTSYTSFTMFAGAGTISGGTITVYGYRKA